ncbi:universal stress protein [Aquifex sp.]
MFKRVIVGLDGSPASMVATRQAFNIGKFFDIPVVGVYVIDERLLDESFLLDLSSILGFTYYPGISARVKEVLEEQGKVLLETFAEQGRKEGVKVSIVQIQGIPWKEIVNEADEEDLIVIGRRGKKLLKGVFLSGNAEQIAKNAKCPVYLLPDEEREFKKACVAYDGRENSEFALSIAKGLRDLYKYEIYVLSVVEDKAQAQELKKRVSEILGEEFKFFPYTGIPEEKIVEFCKENEIDLLFMGAFGKGPIKEFFLGSVTSFVLHNLNIPTLLAKKGKG